MVYSNSMKGQMALIIIIGVALLVGGIFFFTPQQSPSFQQSTSSVSQPSFPQDSKPQLESGSDNSIVWEFNGQEWRTMGEAPTCPEPLRFQALTDFSKVTAVLYPGQSRNNDYKPHGGFAFQNVSNDEVAVSAPIDAYLVKASRYIEQGELQYFFVFIHPCGIMYRLDHLAALSPKLQVVMDTLPEAMPDDSRTTPINPPLMVSAGEQIATAVGFKATNNVTFDFGVYDLRNQKPSLHDNEYAPYGICFFDLFSSEESQRLKSLPGYDQNGGKMSDYCR